ncbi:recombination endonuclease [Leptolyngbya phage LPP-2, strain SPI]|uniref:Recombination endonuclease n=1 Tax=Leptolyngbya phage LPP-2, strain SPI TaxID=2996053 RepID=A0AAE9Q196_9CAUD|nr:recombination endonuclease [Leptolyngbya phage LPP-2 st. SPI]
MKQCTRCKSVKEHKDFNKNRTQKDGYSHYCRDCSNRYYKQRKREYHYKNRYGMSLSDYEKLFQLQDGKCAICRTKQPEGRLLVVDHCHVTGDVRGLLCPKCNTGLGQFNDNSDLLKAAVNYIEVHR